MNRKEKFILKKNRMMRFASGLLVAVLLTTCVISGTYAKYVTTASGSDTARVAKFGVTVTADGSAFAKEYVTDDATVVGTIAKSVVSSDDSKLVAPGTKGDMAGFTLSGTPEVAVQVKYEVTGLTFSGWTDKEDAYYCPLEIKVGDTTYKGLDYASADAFAEAIKTAVAGYTQNYAPNTDLSGATVQVPSLSWSWPFETNGNDEKDTWLGDQAAAGNASTVALEVTATVTQID